ncbi:hypothetical protein KDL44_15935 [bacterium]|nr:hypothetical protein [bacterium]
MHNLAKIILNLDRRIIYSVVMLCVAIPLIRPFGLPFRVTPEVRDGYELIESLKEGDVIVISCDYGPSAEAETHPMYVALLHQCFRKGIRPVILTLIPDGPGLANRGLEDVLAYQDAEGQKPYEHLESGKDYVFLGFKTGGQAIMIGIGQGFTGTFPTDYNAQETAAMPIFRDAPKLADTKCVFDIASVGYPDFWIPYGTERAGIPFIVSCTAVSAPQYYPYYAAGQATGLIGGMKGAAEYESLVDMAAITGSDGPATKGLDAQSAVHVFIILAIIIANIFYIIDRRRPLSGGVA